MLFSIVYAVIRLLIDLVTVRSEAMHPPALS